MADITLLQIQQLLEASEKRLEKRINAHTDERIDGLAAAMGTRIDGLAATMDARIGKLESTMLENFRYIGETITDIHDVIDARFRLKAAWKRFWSRLL